MKPYYITTAIDYTNAAPHIGHAYEKVLADVMARFQRLNGREVFFLTGVDQHGQKVQKKALESQLQKMYEGYHGGLKGLDQVKETAAKSPMPPDGWTIQNITEISKPFPPPPGLSKVKPLTDGFILLTPEGIETAFAQDLTKEEKALLVAVQPQTAGSIFEAKPTAAAWRSKPSWYIVASSDNMIAPEQEKSMAKQIGAITFVLPSSHVAMLSHPKEVANVIEDAAAGKK